MAWQKKLIWIFIVAFAVSGCAHYPINPVLMPGTGPAVTAPNSSTRANDQDLLIILALSGGGTRAAAFSYGVMQSLRDTEIEIKGQHRKLLNEVDLVSALSGTGFVAAYYGLNRDTFFPDFEKKFLKRNIEWGMFQYAFLNPITIVRIMSPNFGRSDAVAEYIDRLLFHGATMGDLDRNGPPRININTTDITFGTRITLDRDFFRLICSDYDSFPVSRAVAASTAMIGLLTPVAINNYADKCNAPLREKLEAMEIDPGQDARVYQAKQRTASILNSKERPYLHLVDGALADGLSVRSAFAEYFFARQFRKEIGVPPPDLPPTVLLISVSASEEPNPKWDRTPKGPGLGTILQNSTKFLFEAYDLETLELIKTISREFRNPEQCLKVVKDPQICASLRLYVVEVNFKGVKDPDLKAKIRFIPSNYNLPDRDVDALIQAGQEATRDSATLKEFISREK